MIDYNLHNFITILAIGILGNWLIRKAREKYGI